MAEDKAPKGDCKVATLSDSKFVKDKVEYRTLQIEGDAYTVLPEGWSYVGYKTVEESKAGRIAIASHNWGVDMVCFEPASKAAVEKGLQALNAAAGVAGAGAAMAVGAGGLALAGGAGAVGAAAVMAGGGAVLAPAMIAGGGLLVGAAIVGGGAVLAGAAIGAVIAKKVGDLFVSACYKNQPGDKWYNQIAKYVNVKNGAVDNQCGYAGNVLKKEWLGTNHFRSPMPLIKDATSRALLVKKAAPDAEDAGADLAAAEDVPPTIATCPMDFEEGMHINVPVGCVLISQDDLGWDKLEGEHKSLLVCAVKDHGAVELTAEALAAKGDLSKLSYIKAGKRVSLDFYSGPEFDGQHVVMDYASPSFVHLAFPDKSSVNDKVKSLKFQSEFGVDAVNTCDEYRDILFKADEKQVLLDAVKAGQVDME